MCVCVCVCVCVCGLNEKDVLIFEKAEVTQKPVWEKIVISTHKYVNVSI